MESRRGSRDGENEKEIELEARKDMKGKEGREEGG